MFLPFQTVTNLSTQTDVLRHRTYGCIETANERLVAVRLRPFPKWGSLWEVWRDSRWRHQSPGNRCRLYYNQPWGMRNFISLSYVASYQSTTLATMQIALAALDEIARLKQTDALVCDVSNSRISDRALQRYGWEPHCQHLPGRHFIKRFYGVYPAVKRGGTLASST